MNGTNTNVSRAELPVLWNYCSVTSFFASDRAVDFDVSTFDEHNSTAFGGVHKEMPIHRHLQTSLDLEQITQLSNCAKVSQFLLLFGKIGVVGIIIQSSSRRQAFPQHVAMPRLPTMLSQKSMQVVQDF